ncbi:Putative negative regulator of RcsB-dependent stress response [Syntrophus gentianae]|uniref:Putative negative regulator of RcsB-dependent stress response n=1 Tax=Syntrophus gentianae TaxID=43775 RepID=A0A1H7XH39_9BACT|nr:tetratricopeptide repeat protein [Syntrophus gentianae]SEM32518.1 Putative negative regulator of RcsB-dependent stress response [Syntrophus gentianae]
MTKKGEAELNQPDQFHTIFNKLVDFYILNRKKVVLTAGVIVGVLAIIIAWTSYRHFYEKNAWEEYVKIEEFMLKSASSDKSDELIKKYKNLSQNYPDSQAANLSSYRMANLYFNKNDLDAAISSYEKFLSPASDRNELKVLSYSGLAYCHEAKKDFNKALQALQQAEKIEGAKSLETFIYRDMGRICEKMGNPGEALKYYKKALAQSMDPTFTMFIKRKIALLS